VYLIAEIGSNWDGDIELAKDHIMACKEAGADAVKFQLWKTDIVYPNNPENKKWEMSFKQAKELYGYSRQMGITCFFTPSYPEAVDFLESIKVPMYKIASVTSAQKHPLALETMKKVAITGKPVIISYGMGNESGDIFKENHLIRLNCVSKYPAKPSDYEYKYDKVYGYVGLSDHTKGTSLMISYLQQYPDIVIEKHVKLRDNSSPDSPFSLYIQELADFITLSKSSLFKLG
jgi:sialic acid synthase SpsE